MLRSHLQASGTAVTVIVSSKRWLKMGINKKMEFKPDPRQINNIEVGVYECEIHLKFRLIEEKSLLRDLGDRDQLLQVLLDALNEGSDEFLETLQANVKKQEISELKASPQMRRQLMRLRQLQEYQDDAGELEDSPQTLPSETNTITIKIPEESLQKLQETATILEVPIEELVQVRVEEVLNQPDEASFKNAVDYVLEKNTELYNRLA
jgi:Npun R1517